MASSHGPLGLEQLAAAVVRDVAQPGRPTHQPRALTLHRAGGETWEKLERPRSGPTFVFRLPNDQVRPMRCGGETDGEVRAIAAPILIGMAAGHYFCSELAPHETRVWVVDLDAGLTPEDDGDAPEWDAERGLLSADEQARADRSSGFGSPADLFAAAAALREILGQLIAIHAGSVRFRAAGHGKPGGPDWGAMGAVDTAGRSALQFNVSHSAGLGLVAVGRGPRWVSTSKRCGRSLRRRESSHPTSRRPSWLRSARSPTRPNPWPSSGAGRGRRRFSKVWGSAWPDWRLVTNLAGIDALTPQFVPATPLFRIGDWHLWETTPRPGYVAVLAIHEPECPVKYSSS